MQDPWDSLPEKFLTRLDSYVPQERLVQVKTAFCTNRNVSFRTNTLKMSSKELQTALKGQGFILEQISWYKDAFVLQNKSKAQLMDTDLYRGGFLYIQNISSMIPPLVLDPQATDSILDMAASPGSKTTQIASLMENQGEIIANDKSHKRLFKLLENLKQQGVTNTKTSAIPGEFLWRKYLEYFDKILVDAPCSMEGRICCSNPDSYTDWSPRKNKELSNLQKWLLRSAITCTKVGGTIVYSTCAMDPMENEEVVDWALKKMPGVAEILPVQIVNLTTDPGLTLWEKKTYSPELAKTSRIYPTDTMEGFFICKLKKIKSSISL